MRYGAAATMALVAALAGVLAGCSDDGGPERPTVVVYTALDQIYSEPILAEFERRTGVRVRCVYDTEAAKTTGLINRLLARRDRPDCDVLWNNEILQTRRLAAEGLLAPYVSGQAERFARSCRDADGRWTGFAGRLRVIIYNTDRIDPADVPVRLTDWTDPRWRGQAAVARPFYGTTLTHMVLLRRRWGREKFVAFLRGLRANDTALCAGNGHVRDIVASGERAFGLTDTDDAHGAIRDGKPVAVMIPDPDAGAVLIPNTVALIAGGPNAEAGRKLVDYLLSAEVERKLAASRSGQIPLAADLDDVRTPWADVPGAAHRVVAAVADPAEAVTQTLRDLQAAGMDR